MDLKDANITETVFVLGLHIQAVLLPKIEMGKKRSGYNCGD